MVICNSETIKAGMIQLDTDPTKIREIYKGVDTQKFSPKWNNNRLRSKGVNEAPTIISIRNLTPIYNVEMLIRAIPLVLDKVPEAKFIICGDGEQRDYLERLADSLGIASAIRFVGWIPHEELPKYLASSDIYVSTSLSDSCPVSLQEAMACELPPVVTDIPANREWITGGKNGYLIPINDAQLLAGKIIHLIKNKRVRRVTRIIEIIDIDPLTKEIITNEVFSWDPVTDTFRYSGRSYILEKIRSELGISKDEITKELNRRIKLVNWLIGKDQISFRECVQMIEEYRERPDELLGRIEKND